MGHRANSCRTNFTSFAVVKCFKCGHTGHKADACRNRASNTHQVACVQAAPEANDDSVSNGFVELKNGKKLPVVNAVMAPHSKPLVRGMPVMTGKVAGRRIIVLRDTESSTIIVRRDLIRDSELTGKSSLVCTFDRAIIRLPEAKVKIETSFYSGTVCLLCGQSIV